MTCSFTYSFPYLKHLNPYFACSQILYVLSCTFLQQIWSREGSYVLDPLVMTMLSRARANSLETSSEVKMKNGSTTGWGTCHYLPINR
uniref:Uncharacterized protein n=1 Tax=Lepeophtheirus salmonis TaxID=72036 RepID=A0A0K2U980_LEPSM